MVANAMQHGTIQGVPCVGTKIAPPLRLYNSWSVLRQSNFLLRPPLLQGDQNFKKYKEQLGIVSENGILVCKGRLENSDLDIEVKYPVILPKDNKFAELLVLDCHERVHHCKVRTMLAEVRSRFWITKGRCCDSSPHVIVVIDRWKSAGVGRKRKVRSGSRE